MKNRLNIITVMIMLFTVPISTTLHAEISVIVNPVAEISSANKKAIKKLFLGRSPSLNGTLLIPVDQEEGAALRDEFYLKVTKKNSAKLRVYWSKMIFSGKAIPPDIIGNDAAVMAWVGKKLNSVGYVNSESVDASVKVILVVP